MEHRLMPKQKDGVNKSQAVREVLATNPNMKPKDVVAALAAKGLKVNTPLVYFVKGQLKGKKGRRKQMQKQAAPAGSTVAATPSGNGDALSTILKVKKLAGEVGGIKKLKALVEAL